jgi:hypothetical protein
MTPYGIKLVWAGWKDDPVIGFSNQGHNRWKASVKPGTRMLVYETGKTPPGTKYVGTKSIVGEIEVTGSFEDGEKYRAPNEQHDRLLPVKVLRPRREGKSISLARVRELIGDEGWPRMGETWKPLEKEVYDQVCAELEK